MSSCDFGSSFSAAAFRLQSGTRFITQHTAHNGCGAGCLTWPPVQPGGLLWLYCVQSGCELCCSVSAAFVCFSLWQPECCGLGHGCMKACMCKLLSASGCYVNVAPQGHMHLSFLTTRTYVRAPVRMDCIAPGCTRGYCSVVIHRNCIDQCRPCSRGGSCMCQNTLVMHDSFQLMHTLSSARTTFGTRLHIGKQ
jgi:hypothetical protein